MREPLRAYCQRTNAAGLLAQRDIQRNQPLSPDTVSYGSKRRGWWRCEKGHDYQAPVAARTINGSGCPYCAGKKVLPGFNDLASREPLLAKQWHPALNGSLTPEMVTCGSHRKVWWQCPGGHVWKAVVYSRAEPKQCGCPVCRKKAGVPAADGKEGGAVMIAKQSLLERMAIQVGCTYLSDLRFLNNKQRRYLAKKLEPLHPREEDIREWNDALDYLTGAPPEHTALAAKERLVSLLSQPCGAGIDKAT